MLNSAFNNNDNILELILAVLILIAIALTGAWYGRTRLLSD
jgi:hypothetical protein